MNRVVALLMVLTMSPSILIASPNDTEVAYGSEQLLLETFESIRNFDDIVVADVNDKNMPAVLARLKEMPKLETLKLHGCDLSNVDEKSPVPQKVKTVLIAGGRISHGTLRWLSRFPKGVELVFGGQDMRGFSLDDLGRFSWLTFDNCKISRSAVTKLVEAMTQVTFKEVTLAEAQTP